jgi:hypothetical protein
MIGRVLTERESEDRRDQAIFDELERKSMNTTPIRTYRASEMPLVMDCPGAKHGEHDAVLINPNDLAGSLGTCAHDVLGAHILNQEKPLAHYMAKRCIPEQYTTDLQIMTAIGKIFWEEYGHLFPNFKVEANYETVKDGVLYTGHTDLSSWSDDLVHVLDWKSTRLEGCNYMPQMMRYLWLAMFDPEYAGMNRFKYTICFLRDKTIESSIEFTRDDLNRFHQEFEERVLKWDGKTYCPGGNCTYCPRIATCQAHVNMLRATSKMFAAEDIPTMVYNLPEYDVVTLYQQIKYAEGFLEKARYSIKLRTQAHGNILVGDGAKDLILREQQKTTIDPMKAWPLMQDKLTDEEIGPCVKVSKTSLLDAIAAKVGRGGKKKAKENFLKELEDAEAVSYKPYFVQALVRHIPQIEETVVDNESD